MITRACKPLALGLECLQLGGVVLCRACLVPCVQDMGDACMRSQTLSLVSAEIECTVVNKKVCAAGVLRLRLSKYICLSCLVAGSVKGRRLRPRSAESSVSCLGGNTVVSRAATWSLALSVLLRGHFQSVCCTALFSCLADLGLLFRMTEHTYLGPNIYCLSRVSSSLFQARQKATNVSVCLKIRKA